MRYEVAVDTNIAFHTKRIPYALGDFPQPETAAIEFEGRRFVWHANPPEDGQEYLPTVTMTVEDANDYAAERLAMERFLSALSFMTRQRIEVVTAGGAGMPAEFDPVGAEYSVSPRRKAIRRGGWSRSHSASNWLLSPARSGTRARVNLKKP